MGLTHVTVALLPRGADSSQPYEELFLVDTGATDSMAPAEKLRDAGIESIGRMAYELVDGSTVDYHFGWAVIEFMGEVTAGRVILGPDECEPLLGVTALESVGITVDPTSQKLKRLPSIPLKHIHEDRSGPPDNDWRAAIDAGDNRCRRIGTANHPQMNRRQRTNPCRSARSAASAVHQNEN